MAGDGETDEERNARTRRKRNLVLALVLGGLVVLFFLMTIVRMAQVGP